MDLSFLGRTEDQLEFSYLGKESYWRSVIVNLLIKATNNIRTTNLSDT